MNRGSSAFFFNCLVPKDLEVLFRRSASVASAVLRERDFLETTEGLKFGAAKGASSGAACARGSGAD